MLGRIGSWIVWWAALFWLWLLLTGDWNRIELIGAACGAAVAATIAEIVRASAGQSVRAPLGRLRAGPMALLAVFSDFGVLVYALARSAADRRVVRGVFVRREGGAGAKSTPAGTAHRAWTVLIAGFSPNAYVVDIDPDADTVLLHDLVPWRLSEEPAGR